MKPVIVHMSIDDMSNSSGLDFLIALLFFALHNDMFSWEVWWMITIGAEPVKENTKLETESRKTDELLESKLDEDLSV